jgi:hypothetical protein
MVATAILAAASPAAADTVSDWWEAGNRLQPPGAPGTPDQQRATSRAALAMFEAVNAIDRRYESYLGFPAGDPRASQDAAAATAAFKVLLAHLPQHKAVLEESYTLFMAGLPNGAAKDAGRLIGEKAAEAAMTAGGIDPAIAQTPYRPLTPRPGQWVPTGLPSIEPYSSAYRPWAMASPSALRPPPPPALTSEVWARDYEEVRRLGAKTSTERTPEQTLIARYRQAFDLTPSMRLAADAPGRRPVQNARMFALYQMAFDDAAMAMAEAKAHYDYWRPITAIRNGADDGNPATQPDAGWTPLISTPNFAEYPCGHCVIAGALAEVMTAEVGPRPATGVRVASLIVPNGVVQVLPSWDEWSRQVSDSRMYAGVHFRFSNTVGEDLGRRAARVVLDKVMRPLPER